MRADDLSASETSPLLGSSDGDGHVKPSRVDGTIDDNAADNDDNADLERYSTTDSGREAQFKGNPEMQKRLKYILFAVGIGVCLYRVAFATSMTDWCFRYFFQQRTKPSLSQAMARLVAISMPSILQAG